MRGYYRVMLGRKSARAAECFAGGFIGADFDIHEDLSRNLPEEWREGFIIALEDDQKLRWAPAAVPAI
jgi:hypothetical protein